MSRLLSLLLVFTCVALGGCASTSSRSQAEQGTTLTSIQERKTDPQLDAIDQLRRENRLEESRTLAMESLASHPDDPDFLWRASRAESDAVYLMHDEDSEVRDAAAAHALELARRARKAGADSIDAEAQYAWAMGNATHLQPMWRRSGHARATKKTIDAVLNEDMEQPTALATAALLQYRLSILPTMVKVMAFTAPRGDLARAERYALAAQASEPSRLNALILAKIELAREKPSAAAEILRAAIEAPDRFPRDAELYLELVELLETCDI